MFKRCPLLLLSLSFSGFAAIDCPSYPNLSACLEAASLEFDNNKHSMADYLHDKDNLADRYYAWSMLNVTIPERYEDDKARCHSTCPN